MNCLTCNTVIPFGAKNCKYCGVDVSYMSDIEDTKSSTSDKLLLLFICFAFFATVLQYVLRELSVKGIIGDIQYIQNTLWLLQNLSFLLVPFAIKNKNLKTAGFIVMSLVVSYWVYMNIASFIN